MHEVEGGLPAGKALGQKITTYALQQANTGVIRTLNERHLP